MKVTYRLCIHFRYCTEICVLWRRCGPEKSWSETKLCCASKLRGLIQWIIWLLLKVCCYQWNSSLQKHCWRGTSLSIPNLLLLFLVNNRCPIIVSKKPFLFSTSCLLNSVRKKTWKMCSNHAVLTRKTLILWRWTLHSFGSGQLRGRRKHLQYLLHLWQL